MQLIDLFSGGILMELLSKKGVVIFSIISTSLFIVATLILSFIDFDVKQRDSVLGMAYLDGLSIIIVFYCVLATIMRAIMILQNTHCDKQPRKEL